jgi:hypothetical protein
MAGETLPLPVRVGLMLAAIPIAYASQRWLEDPIRRGRLVGVVPRRNLALAGALSVAVAGASLGLGFVTTQRLAAASTSDPDGPPAELPDIGGLAPAPTAPSSSSAPGSPAPSSGPSVAPAPAGPVPVDLVPPLTAARDDIPEIYANGCHLTQPATEIADCAFGDVTSTTAVILIGDSHAAQWFPALDRLATERGWRLVSMTKSGCTPAAITVWNTNFKRAYTECDSWRAAVIERVAAERPAVVIVASSHPYPVAENGARAPDDDGTRLAEGLARTLSDLVPLAGQVVLLGDTPKFAVDPPECLSAHLDDALACSESRATMLDPAWIETEASVAGVTGAAFVDPTGWACPTDPCPAVIGRFLVYRDQHHLATPYVIALRDRLADAMPSLAAH